LSQNIQRKNRAFEDFGGLQNNNLIYFNSDTHLYPAGLDFLVAFFGCLYAGVVAVTTYPPRNERNTPRIKAISIDAQAAIALTTTEILPTVRSLMSQKTDLESLQWLTTDNLAEGIEDAWR
jgi:acyl-CoA synthetase (AMP-forming)/AMP-acid ligase II